jgi:Xaa-Pro aminopeptidase
MKKEFYINRREEFFKVLPNKSIAIINSGIIQYMSEDGDYPFEVNRNFYYFTGISFPEMKLILTRINNLTKATLCIPRIDHDKEKWTGKYYTKDECKFVSGITDIIYLDEIDDFLHSHISVHLVDKCFLYLDNVKTGHPQTLNNLTYFDITKKYPLLQIKELSTLTIPMRSRKTPEELDMMREACIIAQAGVNETLKNIKPGLAEYEVQACFEYVVRRKGAKPSFNTIAASGDNTVCLHYTKNNSTMADGDMLLMDCGASLNWYCSDVTRTFPVNGKFTKRQLEFYNIVLKANKTVIAAAKPGMTIKELNDIVIDVYSEELKRVGLISEDSEIPNYYYHGVSHSLGMDTHDVFDRNIPLEEGMVITVEPGIYIEKYGLGIRIEDYILITKKGCEVLTDIVKEPDQIEEMMDIWEVK